MIGTHPPKQHAAAIGAGPLDCLHDEAFRVLIVGPKHFTDYPLRAVLDKQPTKRLPDVTRSTTCTCGGRWCALTTREAILDVGRFMRGEPLQNVVGKFVFHFRECRVRGEPSLEKRRLVRRAAGAVDFLRVEIAQRAEGRARMPRR